MSRKEFDASRMRRLKRYAARFGVTILTDDKMKALRKPGGHAIRDDETHQILYGNVPTPFSATLDDIEQWLEENTAGEE